MANVILCPPAIAQGADVCLLTRLDVIKQRRRWRRMFKHQLERRLELEHFIAELHYEAGIEYARSN